MSQTSVSEYVEAIVGLLADNTRKKDCAARVNAEASAGIPFGLMVKRGTDENEVVLISALADAMDGIATFGHSFAKPQELDTDGIQPGTVFDVLQRGRIYVAPEADVARTDKVYVRMLTGDAAEPAGSFSPATTLNALVYADHTFTAAGSDIVTITTHGLLTGDGPFRLTTDMADLPLNLLTGTDYYVIKIDASTLYLATSRANAIAGSRVDIGDAGTGTHTLADVAGTKRVSSMDISKLARWIKGADISAGELAVLEIDMLKAALATVG